MRSDVSPLLLSGILRRPTVLSRICESLGRSIRFGTVDAPLRSCRLRVPRRAVPLRPRRRLCVRATTAVNPKGKNVKRMREGVGMSFDYSVVQRNLALELVRVTEAAALAAAKWFGKGDKNAADKAAVDMMRRVLNTTRMDGVIVIGEGEKDEAPMLYCGEKIGDGNPPEVEIAVDPLDGTTLTAQGRNGAVTVIALAEKGALLDPGPCMYMEKIAVGPDVDFDRISLEYSVRENLEQVAMDLEKPISDVTVLILDRPRHEKLIHDCREAGARIRLISDGDVSGAIEVAKAGAPVDVMMGIGGSPEGVIAACALKCMGGYIEGRLYPRNDEERRKAQELGIDTNKIYTLDEICKGNQVFFAGTGVSDGDLLKGVRLYSGGATTNSLVMRAESGTVRYIETYHHWAKPSITNIKRHGPHGTIEED